MIELPESANLARQIRETLTGKMIVSADAGTSAHKFAWYTADPAEYGAKLTGRTVDAARAVAGYVLMDLSGMTLRFHDGINLRYREAGGTAPEKHQLQLVFDDDSALAATVSMYGGIEAYDTPDDNPYFRAAMEKPTPYEDAFDEAYFDSIVKAAKRTLSAKALLATEQRIPGLGNGVLQDILFGARVNPTKKLQALSDAELGALYRSIKTVLSDMLRLNGRDSEHDLFGKSGDYRTLRSCPACPTCGCAITRKAYMGGNVYFCPVCQKP